MDELYKKTLDDLYEKAKRATKRSKSYCSEAFLRGYLEAALFSTTDNSDESGGEALDRNYDISNFPKKELAKAKKDCSDFVEANKPDLDATGASDEALGADFWFTREGHGTGFWDRGYPDAAAKHLTHAAKVFGDANLYVHRGRLYFG